jgi:hypothetical protein
MMEQTTTEITDLPTRSDTIRSGSQQIDEGQIRQLVNGIQEASLKGATRLRSSDIPKDPISLTVDKEVIPQIERREPVSDHHVDTSSKQTSPLDFITNVSVEVQIPIIMGVLAGATQLSSVSIYLRETFKWMYTDDGYLSWMGWLAYIIVFGIVWYIVGYVVRKLAR